MAPKGWEWKEEDKAWVGEYPYAIALDIDKTMATDWEPNILSFGDVYGTVYVDDNGDGHWQISVYIDGGSWDVEFDEYMLKNGDEPDWDKVDTMLDKMYDKIREACIERVQEDYEDGGEW